VGHVEAASHFRPQHLPLLCHVTTVRQDFAQSFVNRLSVEAIPSDLVQTKTVIRSGFGLGSLLPPRAQWTTRVLNRTGGPLRLEVWGPSSWSWSASAKVHYADVLEDGLEWVERMPSRELHFYSPAAEVSTATDEKEHAGEQHAAAPSEHPGGMLRNPWVPTPCYSTPCHGQSVRLVRAVDGTVQARTD